MNPLDKLIASAQLGLSVLFLTGYFTVLILFMLGYARIPTDFKEAFSGLLSLMTAGGLAILYFWFQRTRAGGVPEQPSVGPVAHVESMTVEAKSTDKSVESSSSPGTP